MASFDVPLLAIVGRAALEALVRDRPDAVLRMKGVAVFDEDPTNPAGSFVAARRRAPHGTLHQRTAAAG
ncbi:hypothetical protein [Gemmatimonas sp.]|uniref:hypothetical protein n=1 Tax=Gemmatimonas sp. TaxID=1962908 RepID=UPI0035650AE0